MPWRSFRPSKPSSLTLHKNGPTEPLHDCAALEHLKQLRQALLDHLLNLIVVILLLTMVLLTAMLTTVLPWVTTIARCLGRRWHLVDISTLEVYEDPTLVLLGAVLQSQFTAHLFNSWLDLLDMVPAMVAFAHNDMQMAFSPLPGNPDPLFQNILGLFYEQAVEVNGIASHAALGVVFPEDVVARLVVVLVHFRCMGFALFRELVSTRSIAGFVCLMRAVET